MSNLVGFIALVCSPAKIGQIVVGLIAIFVASLHARRARANESFQDYKSDSASPVTRMEGYVRTAFGIQARLAALPGTNKVGMASASTRPDFSAFVGYHVPRKAHDVTPRHGAL